MRDMQTHRLQYCIQREMAVPSNILFGELQRLGGVLFNVMSLILVSQVLTELLGRQTKLVRQIHCSPYKLQLLTVNRS